jgi:SOS-response transcriptional repressor LexA
MEDPDDIEHNSIYNGNYVIVDTEDKQPNGDVMVAIIDNKYSTIRRMFPEGNFIKIVPHNPRCRTYKMPKNDVEINRQGCICA